MLKYCYWTAENLLRIKDWKEIQFFSCLFKHGMVEFYQFEHKSKRLREKL